MFFSELNLNLTQTSCVYDHNFSRELFSNARLNTYGGLGARATWKCKTLRRVKQGKLLAGINTSFKFVQSGSELSSDV